MTKKTREMADRTWELRYKVYRAMTEERIPERDALIEATPGDRNRRKKLGTWAANGLWPIPESELRERGFASPQAPEPSQTTEYHSAPQDTTDTPQATTPVISDTTLPPHDTTQKDEGTMEAPLPRNTTPIPRIHETPINAAPPLTTTTLPQLDEGTINTLMEVAEWWKKQTDKEKLTVTPIDYGPDFGGEIKNSSVRLNVSLRNDALAKARAQHRLETRGNVSGLMDWLLWNYLNCDEKYLAPQDTTPSDAGRLEEEE